MTSKVIFFLLLLVYLSYDNFIETTSLISSLLAQITNALLITDTLLADPFLTQRERKYSTEIVLVLY